MLTRPLALPVLLEAHALALTRRLLRAQHRPSILSLVQRSALLVQQVKLAVLRIQLALSQSLSAPRTLPPFLELEPAP
jgi:hypothetical protein